MIENQVLEALATTLVERMERLLIQRMHFEIAINMVLGSEAVQDHYLDSEELKRLEKLIRDACVENAMKRARACPRTEKAAGIAGGHVRHRTPRESGPQIYSWQDRAAGAEVEDRRDEHDAAS